MKFDYMNLPVLPKEERKLVGFVVDEVGYGLHIMSVREVIPPSTLTVVPSMPSYVVGVLDHRNEVVPIVDLRQRFSLPPKERDRRTKWIIAKLESMEVGLEVDRVTDVMNLDPSQKREKLKVSEDEKPWIKDIYHRGGSGLVFEINLSVLIDATHLRNSIF